MKSTVPPPVLLPDSSEPLFHSKAGLTASTRLYKNGEGRLDVVPDPAGGKLRIEGLNGRIPRGIARIVDSNGTARIADPEEALTILKSAGIPSLRISQEVAPWLEAHHRADERRQALREYEQNVQSGEWRLWAGARNPLTEL